MAEPVTCAESEELLAFAALGMLTSTEGAPLHEHIGGCAACRRASAGYLEAAASLPDALEPVEPPASLRGRVLRSAAADPTPARRRCSWAPLQRSMARRRMLSLAGAALTAAAVAVALIAVLRPATTATRTFTVVGTTTEHAVRGTLTYEPDSQQAVMTVFGLPQPMSAASAPPRVYEIWLVSGSGAAEGAAFLTQSPSTGSWTAVMHADLSRFVAAAATAEPAGGSPQPTGPQLLTAHLTR